MGARTSCRQELWSCGLSWELGQGGSAAGRLLSQTAPRSNAQEVFKGSPVLQGTCDHHLSSSSTIALSQTV